MILIAILLSFFFFFISAQRGLIEHSVGYERTVSSYNDHGSVDQSIGQVHRYALSIADAR